MVEVGRMPSTDIGRTHAGISGASTPPLFSLFLRCLVMGWHTTVNQLPPAASLAFVRYAYGVTLWELFTGAHVFEGVPKQALVHQVTTEHRCSRSGGEGWKRRGARESMVRLKQSPESGTVGPGIRSLCEANACLLESSHPGATCLCTEPFFQCPKCLPPHGQLELCPMIYGDTDGHLLIDGHPTHCGGLCPLHRRPVFPSSAPRKFVQLAEWCWNKDVHVR
jgi:hypothetical protein